MAPGAGDISSCHFGHSVLWITIETGEPRVRPWRTPPRSSTSSRSKRMRGTAAEAETAAGELVADLLDGDGQARGQTFDDHREGGAVGLTGGQVAQHADDLSNQAGKGTLQDTGALAAAPLIRPRTGRIRPARSGALVPVEDRCADQDGGDRAGGEERTERHRLALPADLGGDQDQIPMTAP